METRRTNPKAQPEIHFGAGFTVPASPASDAAVTAAFIAFHRNTSRAAVARPKAGFISRGGLALAALALLGFGGGLSLAFFSFNSPEKSGSVAASRPPEIIYTAPVTPERAAEAAAAPVYDVSGELGLFADTRLELRAEDQPIPDTSIWRDFDDARFSSFAAPHGHGTAAFAQLGHQPVSGASVVGAPGADVTTGFDALTAAPVPEPSTWATMISGTGLLMLFSRFKRRSR